MKKSGLSALHLSALYGCRKVWRKEREAEAQVAQRGFIRPVQGDWFTQLEKGRIECSLCPLGCDLKEGERAPCRVRENRDGRGYTLSYGNPALIQEDPVERKPFFHVLPGSRALSISTAGCNLWCKFCEVWDMALVHPEEVHAYDVPPEKVIELALQAGVDSISYAFGEPVVYYEYMKDVAILAKEKGLKNLMHTAGYIQPEPLKELSSLLNGVNVDLKSFDTSFYQEVVGGELDVVLESLKILKRNQVHIEITYIVIPTLNDDLGSIEKMCKWVVDVLGPGVPLHFARFYPLYKLQNLPRTPVSTLDKARDLALETGLQYVYTGRVTGHEGESTYCPSCKETIIHRIGFVIHENNLHDGTCKYCGHKVPGQWY